MTAEEFYHYSYFKTPSSWAEKCLLVSDGMGYTAEADFRIDRKSFYNYLAFYVHQGIFYVEQYGRTHVLRQGEVGILNRMDPHVYYSDSQEILHLLWFHFRGANTAQWMEYMKQNNGLPLLHQMPELEQEFLKAFSLTRGRCSEPELSGHLYSILMKLLAVSPLNIWKDSHIPAELQRVAAYMAKNTHANLTLEQFSAQAGMGKYHFCHMFKKYYGISPMQYYTSRKMEQACTLLSENALSVDEIAERLGYLDTGYFRKAFKNYFGITPSAYRKSYYHP